MSQIVTKSKMAERIQFDLTKDFEVYQEKNPGASVKEFRSFILLTIAKSLRGTNQ